MYFSPPSLQNRRTLDASPAMQLKLRTVFFLVGVILHPGFFGDASLFRGLRSNPVVCFDELISFSAGVWRRRVRLQSAVLVSEWRRCEWSCRALGKSPSCVHTSEVKSVYFS